MKLLSNWGYIFAEGTFVFLLSALTVNRFAPEYLNADVILDSIMSLQNVTLFYWGQNRLASVVPFLLSPIQDGSINLYIRLFLSASLFYAFLWGSAFIIEKAIGHEGNRQPNRRELFLLLSALFLFVFKPSTIFDISIWHIEYTLSYCILIAVCYWWFNNNKLTVNRVAGLFFSLGIAIGVNYSLLIPLLAVLVGIVLIQRKLTLSVIVFLICTLLAFICWWMLARGFYGSTGTYSTFKIQTINASIPAVVRNMLDTIYVYRIVVLLLLYAIFKSLYFYWNIKARYDYTYMAKQITLILGIFCLSWLLVFSSNQWVEMNQYHPRYFFPIFFAGTFIICIEVRNISILKCGKLRFGVTAMATLLLMYHLLTPITPLYDYKIFENQTDLTKYNIFGYAGDYWQIWPSVMYDIANNNESFGFGYRGDGNSLKLSSAAVSILESGANLTVVCLKSSVEKCGNQIESAIGGLILIDTTNMGASGNHILSFALKASDESTIKIE